MRGLIALAPVARADHDGGAENAGPHEPSPSPVVPEELGGECSVTASVAIDDSAGQGGLDALSSNHNHFTVVDRLIECVDVPGGDDMTPYVGSVRAAAAGGTDGPGSDCDGSPDFDPQCETATHGESLAAGWSHGDCYVNHTGCPGTPLYGEKGIFDLYDGTGVNPVTGDTQNLGEVWASAFLGYSLSPDNWVKFCRGVYDDGLNGPVTCSNTDRGGVSASTGGHDVLAWGALTDWSHTGDTMCFLADLQLVATGTTASSGLTKINNADLVGTVQTWLAAAEDCAGMKI